MPLHHVTEWRTLREHPDYAVSDTGRIRRLSTGRELQPSQRPDGYKEVNLRGDGGRTRTVHRLVLTAFRGEPQPGQLTRHLDGDPSNNHIENLAWGSYSENALDRVRHGRDVKASRTHCVNGHAFTPQNTIQDARGTRQCRECMNARGRKYRAKRVR